MTPDEIITNLQHKLEVREMECRALRAERDKAKLLFRAAQKHIDVVLKRLDKSDREKAEAEFQKMMRRQDG